MQYGIAQLNTIIGDVQGNMVKARAAVEKLVGDGADIICLTELFITGYPPRDLIYRKDLIEANVLAAAEIVGWSAEFPGRVIVFGYVEPNPIDGEKDYFNSIIACRDGKIINKRHKVLLPTYDVFSEARYFQAGDADVEFLPFEHKGRKIGIINCEEAWNDPAFWAERLYDVDPVAEMVACGAQEIIVINASPYRMGVIEQRRAMIATHAKRHNVPIIYVNQVGYNDDVGFDGTSFGVNGNGQVIFQSPSFMEEIAVYGTDNFPVPLSVLDAPWQAQIVLAAQCGIRDYVTKLGIKGPVILGLSGGIDSALVAFLAATALGSQRVIGVGLPSEFSSGHSVTDAEKLAKKLGIHWAVEPIKPPHDAVRVAIDGVTAQLYEDVAAQVGGGGFSGEIFGRPRVPVADSGVTDENIQARLRMIYLMGLANYFNGILLTTGNKSEMAVGYCTLYGDMGGGLAVISDLFKTKVFDVCRWINETMRDEIIPWNTINKPPSAELRPDQIDQNSLPPYAVLDEILAAFVEDGKSPDEIAKGMQDYDRQMKYKGETGRDLIEDVYWVCQTTVRNEFKRKQSATGLKFTKKMFRFGWEHPIVHKLPVRGVSKQSGGAQPSFPLGGEKIEDISEVRPNH